MTSWILPREENLNLDTSLSTCPRVVIQRWGRTLTIFPLEKNLKLCRTLRICPQEENQRWGTL